MIATHQDGRHGHAFIRFRPRVVRRIEQAIDEAVLDGRCLRVQDTGQQADHRVHQRHGRQFTTRQDKVADADFLVDATVQQTLVHGFIAATQDHETRLGFQLRHFFVCQRTALRRHEHHAGRGQSQFGLALFRGSDRRFEGTGHHHHAGATAIRAVIHGAVIVSREITGIPQRQATFTLLEGTPGHTRLRQRGKHFREQGHDIKLHRSPSRKYCPAHNQAQAV